MAFYADYIWLDGEFVKWDEAKVHVLSHALHYGTSAFDSIRCYNTDKGSVLFRLEEHISRLYDSCKIYYMDIPFTQEQVCEASVELLRKNNLKAAYIRPFVFRGYGALGITPFKCPVQVCIAAWDWGQYLGDQALEDGISVCISSWHRNAPNTTPAMAKGCC